MNMMQEAGVPKLQRQLVKMENLRQFEERYEEALSQLQEAIKVINFFSPSLCPSHSLHLNLHKTGARDLPSSDRGGPSVYTFPAYPGDG